MLAASALQQRHDGVGDHPAAVHEGSELKFEGRPLLLGAEEAQLDRDVLPLVPAGVHLQTDHAFLGFLRIVQSVPCELTSGSHYCRAGAMSTECQHSVTVSSVAAASIPGLQNR